MVEDFERCYRAVLARDARFDGWFVTAVTSTHIYCRPSCPARTPAARNVRFYPSAAAAQRAGFRACKRCRPDASPGSPEWNVRQDVVARAMRMIGEGVVDRDGVAGLAARLAYSPRQLNRLLVERGRARARWHWPGPSGPRRRGSWWRRRSSRSRRWRSRPGSPACGSSTTPSARSSPAPRPSCAGDRRAGPGPSAGHPEPAPGPPPPLRRARHLGVPGPTGRPRGRGRDADARSPGRSPSPTAAAPSSSSPTSDHVRARLRLDDLRDLTPGGAALPPPARPGRRPRRRGRPLGGRPRDRAHGPARAGPAGPGHRRPPRAGACGPSSASRCRWRAPAASWAGWWPSTASRVADPGQAPARRTGAPHPSLSRHGDDRRARPRPPSPAPPPGPHPGDPGGRHWPAETVALDVGADAEAARWSLRAIPGIGPWTADYIAVRGLGHPDVMLSGDLGVRTRRRSAGPGLHPGGRRRAGPPVATVALLRHPPSVGVAAPTNAARAS